MTPDLNAENIGQALGLEGVDNLVSKVEQYCACEERRIVLKNQPRVLALRATIGMLQDEEREMQRRIANASSAPNLKDGHRKAIYYWTVTLLLSLAAFIFSLLAFDPFRLGWKGYLYCLGIAVTMPFLLEECLERWNLAALVRAVATLASIAGIVSLIALAMIRGNLLAHEVEAGSQVVITDATDPAQPPQDDFYRRTVAYLRLAMVLLAIAMDLGAGLALHRAWNTVANQGEDPERLRAELMQIRQQMIALAAESTQLENEPASFAARFWRNFYHAMLTHAGRSARSKLLLGILVFVAAVTNGYAAERQRFTIVIALDLTQSVASEGPDARTDFEKDVSAVTGLLAHAPASSQIVVLGITDKSFTQPYILLSAQVTGDAGYFGEKLQAARNQLVKAWKGRSSQVEPHFRYTDVVGALATASQIFDNVPTESQKILIILSDMRHHTRELDLESRVSVPRFAELKNRAGVVPVPGLKGVQVYALGVDGAGKSIAYWQSLMRFWSEYFESSGARVRTYSVLRDFQIDGRTEQRR